VSATAVSPLVTAPVPRQVRQEGADAVHGYRAALGFEAMLLEQVLDQALPEAGGEGEEAGAFGSGGDPSVASLPQTVADAVVGAGGLGVATDMYRSFEAAG